MKYYIGWIDDEIWGNKTSPKLFYEERYQDTFNEMDLEVVLFAEDWDTFEAQMARVRHLDAVIFDLNFATTGKPKFEEDDSGFVDARSFIRSQMNKPNPIHCYICTGRDPVQREVLLRHKPENISDEDIFEKDAEGLEAMVSKIKSDLDADNTYEKRIRRRFSKELDLAGTISSKCEEYLQKCLLFAFSEDGYFTPFEIEEKIQFLRDICEKCLLDKCGEEGILPHLSSLGEASKLISSGVLMLKGHVYKLKDDSSLMNTAVTYLFGTVVNNMTNDVKHSKDELKVKIRDHIQESNDLNIYRGMVFMTISILQWFRDNHERLSIDPVWVEIKQPAGEDSPLKKEQDVISSEEAVEVAVEFIDDYHVYSEPYKIKKEKNHQYDIGTRIRINKNGITDNTAWDHNKYPYYVNFDQHSIVEE